MTDFGDDDPVDGWDDNDSEPDRLDVLERVIVALRAQALWRHERRRDALRLVVKMERANETSDRLARIREALEAL